MGKRGEPTPWECIVLFPCLACLVKAVSLQPGISWMGSCGALSMLQPVQRPSSAPGLSTSGLRTRRLAISPMLQITSRWLALQRQGLQSIFGCDELEEGH
jgi:hypothetical protein